MRLHFFAIPALDPGDAQAELDGFMGSHRVVGVDRQLVQDGPGSFWAVCVTVTDGASKKPGGGTARKRIDYKEVLTPEQFAVFARLRDLRKELAAEEGVPAYAVFTNEQLAAMVTRGVSTKAGLGGLSGVGPARADKYGARVLEILCAPSGGARSKVSDATP